MAKPFRCRDPRRKRTIPRRVEQLEIRNMLAPVGWTGLGDGSSWSDPLNWSGGDEPGSGDDVTISATGNPIVLIDSNVVVNSVYVATGATLSITAESLNVSADSTIDGALAMTGGSLNASGSGTTLRANGTTTLTDAGLLAISGATIELPQLTSFSSTNEHPLVSASGAGSQIVLTNLSSISAGGGIIIGAFAAFAFGGGGGSSVTKFQAEAGGVIEMPALQTGPGENVEFESTGLGSTLEFASLTNLQAGQLTVTAGGGIVAPNLTVLQDIGIQTNSTESFTLLPNQTYLSTASFNVNTIDTGTLIVQGGIDVSSYIPLSLPGSLSIDGLGAVSVVSNGTLLISGDLLGSTTNVDQFKPLGTVSLNNFSATVADPQNLEAMSADVGAVQAGFQNNFAYGTLIVGAAGYVRLVDLANNASGSASEAVYANQLLLGANATLDLNGLHLYVRGATIDPTATVINGSVTAPPAGGAISNETPVAGALTVPGQSDNWTFFGRAGQLVTVELNPSIFAQPAALDPQLNLGRVTLLDPNNQVVTFAASSFFSEVATLSAVPLLSNGIYTVRVQAEAPASTGNYVLTTHVVTPSIRPLTFNQTNSGNLASPFAADEWTFSAEAGTVVDLHVRSTVNNNVVFDLFGPSGAVFFGVQTDSDFVGLPDSGNYTLRARSVVGNAGGYSFELQQVSIVNLNLGDTVPGTLVGNGHVQLYTVNMPINELLKVKLDDSSSVDVNEIYVRYGAAPTRGIYDYRSAVAGSADQQLLVPSAYPGTWYILVYGNKVPTPSTYTLQASTTPVLLTEVTPNRSATGSTATLVLAGSGFDGTTTVQLIAADTTVYNATSVSLDTFSQISATFNLSGVPQGSYAVRVTRGDAATATLPNAFMVTAAGEAKLETDLILPDVIGRHIPATFYVVYSNTGNVAMPAPVLLLESSEADDLPLLTLDPALRSQGIWTSALPQGFSNTVQILASGKVPGVLQPGESVTVPVYYVGMQTPWDFVNDPQFFFNLRIFTPENTDLVDWSSLKTSLKPPGLSADAWSAIYGNVTSQLGNTWGEYVQMLDSQATYLGRLGENITDIDRLWPFAILQASNALLPIAQQESASDLNLPMPGVLSLSVNRQYRTSIESHQALGPFGYGWSEDWNYSLTKATDGTVTVKMPSGAQRTFQPDSRGPHYFNGAGDHGVLSAGVGGTFTLTESNGLVQFFNAGGTLGYVQDLNGNRITAGYTAGRLTSLTSSAGGSLTIGYNALDLIESVASSDGRTVNYSYNGKQLVQVQDYDGRTTHYAYDTSGNPAAAHALTSVTFPDGTHEYFTYDALGRLAGSSRDGGASPLTYSYNQGEVTITDFNNNVSHFFFNELGLLVKTIDPLGNVAFTTYDRNFNLASSTGPTGLLQGYTHDQNGNLTSFTNPLGQTSHFTFTGPANLLASATDPRGNTTAYEYDAAGNRTAIRYADHSETKATFNALGDPLSIINQNGLVTSFSYNAVGQVTSEILADGTSYAFVYDAHGNLATATAAAGTITLSYDPGDRLTKVLYPNGRFLQYTYDTGGRRIRMVDQDNHIVNYSYDVVGRLGGLTDGSSAPIVTYTYNTLGQLITAIDGNGSGPYTTYTYDAAGRVLHLVNYAVGSTVNSRFDYTYNALGQTVALVTRDGTWTYSYDSTGQLVHAMLVSTNGSIPNQDLTYVYDAAGNRTQTVINGVTSTYTSNSVNEYTSVTSSDGTTTYQYDAAGNLISKTVTATTSETTTYTYDSLNRLTSVTSPSDSFIYQYDALGNLAATTHNGQVTQNLIDPSGLGNIVGQYNGGGSLIARYVHGLGLVSQITAIGTNYYQFGTVGSTADLVNSAGTIQNSYSYLPFGGLLHSTGTVANPFTFVGQFGVTNDGNGLFNMRARNYDAIVGQFTSNDPIGLLGGSLNLRGYSVNNPIDLIDPTGTSGTVPGDQKNDQELLGDNYAPAGEGAPDVFMTFTGNQNISAQERAETSQVVKKMLEDSMRRELSSFKKPKVEGGKKGATANNKSGEAKDPNAKLGPAGYGSQAFVAADSLLPYEIEFENDAAATAPAQVVKISDPLDANFDLGTFQLTEVSFGDTLLVVPSGTQHYETTVSMTYNNETFNVEITAGLDLATGKVFAIFQSLDPNTGLPPGVLTGFLPPEDGTGRGQGRINYTIKAKPGLATGTEIRNVALITFDVNDAIGTDQIDPHDPSAGIDLTKQALITIDAGPPSSYVNSFASPTQTTTNFTVSWSGQDDASGAIGSGIASYDIFVSDNNAAYTLWKDDTALFSDTYPGVNGHTYRFYSIATDKLGFVEQKSPLAEATTTVSLPLSTTTTVSSTAGSTYGDLFTFQAMISAASGTPTGSVQFQIDSVNVGAPVPLSGGMASFTTTTTLSAGSHNIKAVYTSNASGFLGSQGSFVQQVAKAALTITAADKSKVYGAALPALTVSYSGFVNSDDSGDLTTLPTVTTTATANSNVGTYPITASGAAAANYNISYVSGTLEVTRASLTITADNKSKAQNDPLPTFTASYSGFVNGDTSASLDTSATLSTTATATSAPGDYPIIVSGAADANYTINFVNGNLHVTPPAPTVGADLQLTSTGSPSSIVAGKGTVTYKFTVKNIGTLDATGVKVSLGNVLPAGVSVKSISPPKGTTFSGSSLIGTWNIPSLKKNASLTLTVTLNVGAATAPGTNVISSTATAIFANQGLINTSNDSTTVRTSVTTSADVSISKHTAPKEAATGGTITYVVTVTNSGPGVAQNVTLTDLLPTGTTFVSQTQNSGAAFTLSNTTTQVSNTIAALASKASATFTIVAQVGAGVANKQKLINKATVSTSSADPKTSNNTSSVTTTAIAPTADVSISKHTAPTSVQAGANILYTVTVTNAGPTAANNVTLTDLLPSGTTFVQQTQTSGPSFTLGNTANQVTNTITSLASKASATFSILVQVDGDLPNGQKLNNKVTITSSTSDPKTSNNSSTATTSVTESGASLNASPMDPSKLDLVVTGSSKNDVIVVQPATGGKLSVVLNGKTLGSFSPTRNLVVYGRSGDDTVTVSPLVDRAAILFGGTGNDKLLAGTGASVLSGGDGTDNLIAGLGRNILIGSKGPNTLNGALGENVLVGGYTSYDAHRVALAKLLSEWSRTDADYATRVAHLRGTTPGGNNGTYLLNDPAISDNAALDTLFGDPGNDDEWFLAHTSGGTVDSITGKTAAEELDAI